MQQCLGEIVKEIAFPFPCYLFALDRNGNHHAKRIGAGFGAVAVDVFHLDWCKGTVVKARDLRAVVVRILARLDEEIVFAVVGDNGSIVEGIGVFLGEVKMICGIQRKARNARAHPVLACRHPDQKSWWRRRHSGNR